MITGIGTDLVEIARVQKAIGRSAFLEKVYTEKERELIAKRPTRAAGNFAAKEAVAKALGCGFAGISPIEIEVLREPSGLPFVVLHGKAKKKAEELGVCKIQISITDTAEYAQSYATCEGKEGFAEVKDRSVKRGRTMRKNVMTGDSFYGVPVLGATEMKEVDCKTIEEKGIPSLVLMERAAKAVADCVKTYVTPESKVGVLCGTGNNGGDGVAVARMLTEAGIFAAILVKDPELRMEELHATPEFLQQLKMAEAFDVPICGTEETKSYDIIVDALFGIGLSKPVIGEYAEILERINTEEHTVIAVDIPSGILADTGAVCGVALYADETVTFGAAKYGHLMYPGKEYTGKFTVADIGFPKELLREQKFAMILNEADVENILPERPAYSNKGTFGKVVVVAGSRDMAGAAYFSACAAYRTGAGLVKIATPECNREILQTLLPEAMLAVYEETEDFAAFAKDLADFGDSVIIGPGLGQSDTARKLLIAVRDALCEKETVPSVWDADGLNLITTMMKEKGCDEAAERKAFLEEFLPAGAIVTPHPGELSRLTGKSVSELTTGLLAEAKMLSADSKTVYVLKDAVTVVATGEECFINTTGNNGMATGGSGDALCGVIGALLAAGVSSFPAAAAGVWLHGAAGDKAAKERGAAPMMVRDILRALGELNEEKHDLK